MQTFIARCEILAHYRRIIDKIFEAILKINQSPIQCRRKNFNLWCHNGHKSQYTLRWYFDNESLACVSYPYSYCEENELTHTESTVRTWSECQETCLSKWLRSVRSTNQYYDGVKTNVINVTQASIKSKQKFSTNMLSNV